MAATSATAVVSRLINQAHQRFGAITAIEVPRALWEQVMDEIAAAGGELGFDHCRVDGVTVTAAPAADEPAAAVRLAESGAVRRLPIAG